MKKNVMKGLPKRIVAFIMAGLMILSLMPVDPSIVLADGEESYTYTFMVTDDATENPTSLKNATITLYKTENATEPVVEENYSWDAVKEGEGEEASVVPGKYTLFSNTDLTQYYYVISVDGYKSTSKTQIGAFAEGEDTYEVKLTEKEKISLSFSNVTSTEDSIHLVVGNEFVPQLVVKDIEGKELSNTDITSDITYSTDLTEGSTILTLSENDIITAGNTASEDVVTITATFPGNENYKETSASFKIKVVDKISQTITLDYTTLKDGDNYPEGVEVDEANNQVTYTTDYINEEIKVGVSVDSGLTHTYVISDNDGNDEAYNVVKYDEESKKLVIVGAGTAEITISAIGNATYADAESKKLTIVVEKLEPELSFGEVTEYELICGEYKWDDDDFTAPVLNKSNDLEDAKITYSITDEKGVIDAEKFNTDGKIEFTGKVGEVTITASYDGNDKYTEATASYTINVVYASLDVVDIKVNDAEPTEDAWYNTAVFVTVPEGYTYCEKTGNDIWNDASTLYRHELSSTDGVADEAQKVELLVKNEATGAIGLFTYEYKYDNQAASVSAIKSDTKDLKDSIMDFFKFIFGDDVADGEKKVSIDISVFAEGAPVQSVSYYIDNTNEFQNINANAFLEKKDITWTQMDISDIDDKDSDIDLKLDITEKGTKVIYVKVVDEAGNISCASTDGLVFDATAPEVKVDIQTENINDYYLEDVVIKVSAKENDVVSGIKSIKYVIWKDSTVGTEESLFSSTEVTAITNYIDLVVDTDDLDTPLENIIVKANGNDSQNVRVVVTVEDNAGNVTTVEQPLKIAATAPTITPGVFNDTDYTVNLNVSSREDVYDENGLVISGKVKIDNKETDIVKGTHYTTEWTEGDSTSEKIANIKFVADGSYSDIKVAYTDKVDRKVETTLTSAFIIDNEAPKATITIGESKWESFLEKISFGLWSSDKVELAITATDRVDANPTIEYIKVGASEIKTLDELKSDTLTWESYSSPVTLSQKDGNDTFVIYVRVTDVKGNVDYISSNGYIVDMKTDGDDSIDITAPTEGKREYIIGENIYECYRDDVALKVTVIDDAAGIQKVVYKIGKVDELVSQKPIKLYSYIYDAKNEISPVTETKNESAMVTYDENTKYPMKLQDDIVISAEDYNYDDVTVWVELTDLAGNKTEEILTLNILNEESSVERSNIPIDPITTLDNVDYYNSIYSTEFTIHSRESIFNADGVEIKVLDDDDNPVDESLYSMEYDEDYTAGDEHKFRITFTGSTKYNLDINYKDAIDETASYADVFIVDREKPTGQITIDDTESLLDWLLNKITYGWWFNTDVTVKATGDDALGDVTVEYITLENVSVISKDELSKRNDWKSMPENGVSVSANSAYVVAVKVTDTANNVDYFSSNGFIVDEDNEGDVVSAETTVEQISGYYTGDVPVEITVAEDGAGIQKIAYKIVNGNNVDNATEITLYELVYDKEKQCIVSETYPETAVLKKDTITGFVEEFTDIITVDSKQFDGKDTYIVVTLTDNTGKTTVLEKFEIPIAVETPEMEVTYVDDPEITGRDKKQIAHYQSERKAKIEFTSRDDLFEKANVSIVVEATKDKNAEATYSITWDDTAESGTHIAYVTFPKNAKYDFTVNYSNAVGVAVDEYKEVFVIDDMEPTVDVLVGETSWWEELLENITFGFWNAEVEVSAEYSDITSDIQSVEYIKTSEVKPLTEAELDKLGWKPYTKAIPVDAAETLVVYVKVTDCAGNYKIVSSRGIIVDTVKNPEKALDITLTPMTQPINNYYKERVVVDVVVKDIWDNMTSYSGINKVVYWVTADGNVTQEEQVLYQFNKTEPTYDKLVPELVFNNGEIIIDADKNNSDNVILHVKATDNAGNSYEETKPFKIDSIQPKISLDYESDTAKGIINEYGLYDEARSAKVVITERASSFDDSAATKGIDIIVKDAKGNVVSNADYTISKWRHEGSGDTATHTAKITFNGDGYYTVAVGYTDIAGNVNEQVVTTASENSYQFVVDKTDADVILVADAPSITYENNNHTDAIYTKNFNVELSVDDGTMTSGLQKVEYWIMNGQTKTAGKTLYEFDGNAATIELEQLLVETLPVDAAENNSCDVVLHVTVIDNVGRKVEEELTFDIDVDKPIVSVSFANNSPEAIVGDRGYYVSDRKATVVINKRAEHFDAATFKSCFKITATDVNGVPVNGAYTITEDGDLTDDVHVYTIVFSKDANYIFDVSSYTDKAGLSNEAVKYVEGQNTTPNFFSIDRIAPNGTIAVEGQFESGNVLSWLNKLAEVFTFGLWSPSDVNVSITADDTTSPVKSIQYYKTATFTPMTDTELGKVTTWISGDKFTVSKDDIFVVYAKITDQTGHVRYISTNGIIVDKTKPVVEAVSPEITLTPERPVNGIYDGNVKVDVGVKDPVVGNNSAYAGLRSITYEVYNMGIKTQEGTLYSFSETNPTQDKLVQSWNEQDIIVDASKNNSNDVVVKVTATDNAGNQSTAKANLKIDTAAPVIEVSYDNNNGDTTFADSVYYNVNRVATIKVTERNFDANAVDVDITNTDGTVPTISGWTTTVGTGNGDDTVHTATVVYSADGDYTFAISMKDKAGLANNGVNYGTSQAPTAFTIDKTAPVISVAYDNNDFANENYYKADRTATISILEHNFDASRVVATITATDNGQSVAAPTISGWSKSGDTYTATVNYSADALYTFDIVYSDKAQNQSADFAQQSFYVDKTMPQMSITEIVDQSANNKDQIGFVITATDTNFDVFEPILTAVVKTENGFVTQELNIASVSDITNGRVYTISNIDADGIYRITCTLVDKAGNAYTEVTLHRADGTPYVENRSAEDTLLTFSVNRNGSVFEVNEETQTVLDNYYVYDVTEDVVIVEVNANRLTTNRVTLNGKELVEGTDYVVTTEGGNGAWYKYIYTLNKELFVEEGEYTIVVSSIDEAENSAFSDVKSTKVAFVVDRTAPIVTVSGLETNGKYQTDAQTVTLIPTDDGGAVKSIVVNQIDKDGKIIKVLLEELSGEALEEALVANDGQITFDIPSGQYDYIEIVCTDCSLNAEEGTNTVEILIENVLITESELELIWATYKYAIIIGVVVVIVAPIGILFFKKRKNK